MDWLFFAPPMPVEAQKRMERTLFKDMPQYLSPDSRRRIMKELNTEAGNEKGI